MTSRENAGNNIPIVFAVNDNYVKYVSVAITSIIRHKNKMDQYLIYIFHKDISTAHQEKLEQMSVENVRIECIDVNGKIDSSILYVDGRITEETYYRILIPDILSQWDKVIYLDSDLICLSDIAPMLSIDMGTNEIAGVITVGNENRAEYTIEHLGIPSENYINAGVLIFNNAVLRQKPFLQQCYQLLKEKTYLKWHDQDLLNALCFGRIYFLDPKWNTTVLRLVKERGYNSEREVQKKDLNCCIIHYASVKPWKSEMREVTLPFWECVFATTFTHDIISAYEEISDTKRHFKDMCTKGNTSLDFIIKCLMAGLKCRMRRK